MNRSVYRLIFLGILLTLAGVGLLVYSIHSYIEVHTLYDKVNFDELDNNSRMPTSEKYQKHLSIAEFLNIRLEKNQNIPLKNTSCVYLDYAQHNSVSLYKLIYNGDRNDITRREIVAQNIKNLSKMLNNYKNCRQAPGYKIELEKILDDIKRSDELYNKSARILDTYLYSSNIDEEILDEEEEELQLHKKEKNKYEYMDVPPVESENILPNDTSEINPQTKNNGDIIYSHSYSGEDTEINNSIYEL